MTRKKSDDTVKKLLEGAAGEGTLSAKSAAVLGVPDLGAQIQAGLGISVDDVTASEVVLVTMMPDDSGSIRFAGNADAVRKGHNLVLDALADSKQQGDVLIHCRYLNGAVLYPYTTLDHAVRMTAANYDPSLGTPLYEQSVVVLGTVLAKAQELADNGVPVRTVTLIITDGADGSRSARASDVEAIVDDMFAAEDHVVAGMGISDGTTDFRRVFRNMGIPDAWILTPRGTAGEIRTAFQVFSQSAVRASQGASFSTTALGGFAS